MLTRLVDEHGVDITYSTVRDYVRLRRPEIWAESGAGAGAGVRPADARAGGGGRGRLRGPVGRPARVKTKVFLFIFRLNFSGKAVHWAFASQGQEAFLEGHLHAFAVLGGVINEYHRAA